MAVQQKDYRVMSNTATKIGYTDIIFEMSNTLCQALLEQESDLAQKVHELDAHTKSQTNL